MSRLREMQRWALRVAIVAAVLGLATASGCAPGLGLSRSVLGLLHPLLLLVGGLAGWAAQRRMGEIDAERWRIARDPNLTSGELQYAHREAEARRRRAAAALLGAPLLLGYWGSGQIEASRDSLSAQLLGVTALAGGILGMLVSRRLDRGE